MSSSPKIPADHAHPTAALIRRLLAPACERIEIAGSLRREAEAVGDIEIVAIPGPDFDRRLAQLIWPKPAGGLFEGAEEGAELRASFGGALNSVEDNPNLRLLAWNTANPGNGERMKKLVSRALNLPVELYLAKPDNWGNILAIRTGDADWSRALVEARSRGGFMPRGMRQIGGYLRNGDENAGPNQDWAKLPTCACYEEQTFFDCLGLPWVEPCERNAATAYRLGARTKPILEALDRREAA